MVKMRQQQSSSGGTQERQKINKPSILLSTEENEHVFGLLGRKCQSICTAVIQLYTTDPPAHSIWIKRHTGILCFVRDSSKRSYFVRVYCLLKNELVWEEEMYGTIYINRSKDYLVDFEGRNCLVALNFASEAEANSFYKTATNTISNRAKRRQVRRSKKISPSIPTSSENNEMEPPVTLRNPTSTSALQMNQFSQATPLPSIPFNQSARDRRRPTRKLTKADISMPTDFKHIVHVGWTAQKGLNLNGEEVSNLTAFLEKAGVSEQQLNDRDTRAFIYDFIQNNNVLDSVKLEKDQPDTKQQTVAATGAVAAAAAAAAPPPPPPPVPSRHHNGTQRIAPPPPPAPTRQPPPPLPKCTPPRGAPPTRPPPVSIQTTTSTLPTAGGAPPPPPPPPPPPTIAVNIPPPPPMPNLSPNLSESDTNKTLPNNVTPTANTIDPRNALMDSIRKGATLKKVDPNTLNSNGNNSNNTGDSRNDLLSEIRQGVELRRAVTREPGSNRESNGSGGTDALADALRRALQERNRVIRSSDEDSDDSTDNDGEWDD